MRGPKFFAGWENKLRRICGHDEERESRYGCKQTAQIGLNTVLHVFAKLRDSDWVVSLGPFVLFNCFSHLHLLEFLVIRGFYMSALEREGIDCDQFVVSFDYFEYSRFLHLLGCNL